MGILGALTDTLFWSVLGTVGVFFTLAYLIIKDREADELQRMKNLYSWFKALHYEVNNGQHQSIVSGRVNLPFEWIESRPEYSTMTKKDKKLLQQYYKLK